MLERKFSYRNSKSRDEIVKKLQEKLSTECSFSLWQKDETGKRKFVEKIRFHTLFAGDGVFTVFADQKEMAVFDRERDIYFILEGHDFVFKTKVALEQKSFFTFQIPKEIQLKEHRGEPRVYFSPNERKTVEVSFFLKEIDQQHSIQCPLLNI